MIISELKVDIVSRSNHFQLVFKPQETVDQTMGTSLMNDNSKKLSTWDELLVRVGRDRDKSAFAELFDYFAPRVKSFLLRFGTDMSLAEEIAQEAMIMVWRRAETYDPRQSAASTWIFTIARNKRIDRLRRENRPLPDMTDPAVMPESIETGEIQVARMQQEKKIRHALKNLPEEQAKMIFSAYYEEKSHREIAEESGVALGTVKSRIRLALNRLRAHLNEDEGITP
uniref:RNA polymerase sigma factor n=1 Tax=uncultured alpha proteobacterium EB000_37G09 TaxID=710792 RepID=E0XZJ3_9PROT|nr:DNA-directed RNA polymerase specialized sigma sub unit, sigma24 homolog [uncultured alpha proteobacterium EB000_37G09]